MGIGKMLSMFLREGDTKFVLKLPCVVRSDRVFSADCRDITMCPALFFMRDESGGHAPPGKNYTLSLKFSRSVPRGNGALNSYMLPPKTAADNQPRTGDRRQPRPRPRPDEEEGDWKW